MLRQTAATTLEVRPNRNAILTTRTDVIARELQGSETAEVLAFLSIRPVHTVVMTSFIADNGIESNLNRGKFYGYRNSAGSLEGVALIGHTTLVETRSDAALATLAAAAKHSETPIHLIMSSGDTAERFWTLLSGGNRNARLVCTENLFETSFPFLVQRNEWQIENAGIAQLMPVAEAQAEVAFLESGSDPLVRDREGFLSRVARRIEQNRVFVVFDGEKLVFKADIIAETDDVIYLEGVYVNPELRGRGIGSKCLSALTLKLLERTSHICLLSNIDFGTANKSFRNAGFANTDRCISIFV